MNNKTLYLVCNAHLDPVWLWNWEEGLAETLSTFRTAARLCRKYDNFTFCHNESLLYKWIEEYEPELFSDIKDLVARNQWHFMGGWFVQPDCNLPSGESFVRQIVHGKKFAMSKFDEEPEVAVNLDPFGHSRGLVQILAKAGYTSYLFCRPDKSWLDLPAEDFTWVGYDGSEITAHRAGEHYNSSFGEARTKIEKWMEDNDTADFGILLWGIGDHGGGPSEEDIISIRKLQDENDEWNILHSRPEDYFRHLASNRDNLPTFDGDLNPWAVGCYTSMARVKHLHRQLENNYFSTEKMLTTASVQELIEYPSPDLKQAMEDLLFCEFHDILPGSAIAEVETYALQRLSHGLEIISRLRMKAFYSLLSGQKPPPASNEYPIFIYNHHPHFIESVFICEFQPNEPNFNRDYFLLPELFDDAGNHVPCQLEKESCNIATDQRKRIVFRAKLKPSAMNRYNCRLTKIEAHNPDFGETTIENLETTYPAFKHNHSYYRLKQDFYNTANTDYYDFVNETCQIRINRRTGLIDAYSVNGINYLQPDSFKLLVMDDYPDPWGMKVKSFRDQVGSFTLMNQSDAAENAGVQSGTLESVRIIEDGNVRTIVEALFKYNNSTACVRYKIPQKGCEIEVEMRVLWMEKDKMLKYSVPGRWENSICKGEVAYGIQEFCSDGDEKIAQKWVSLFSPDEEHALTIVNDRTYGFDIKGGELRLSLLRSPAYAGHPVDEVTPIVRQDRFEPRIDQGEHIFRFWIKGGKAEERLKMVVSEAYSKNEPPFSLCCYPNGKGENLPNGIEISSTNVQLTAHKMAENDNWMIMRLFESSGKAASAVIDIPFLDKKFEVHLNGFELKTIAVDLASNEHFEVDLLERKPSLMVTYANHQPPTIKNSVSRGRDNSIFKRNCE